MDFRDTSIITQVAFKAAVEMEADSDLTNPEDRGRFEQVFDYLKTVLFKHIGEGGVAQVIEGHFPGTTQVAPNQQQPMAMSTPATLPVSVRGQQFGPLPDWLLEQAAAKGVHEVYDNRDRAQGTKRPWFRATSGGDEAPAFWPPRNS